MSARLPLLPNRPAGRLACLPDGPAEEVAIAAAALRRAVSCPDLRRALGSLHSAAERQGRIARELELEATLQPRPAAVGQDGGGATPPVAVGSPGEAIRRLACARQAEFHRALQDRFNAIATRLGGRVAARTIFAGDLGAPGPHPAAEAHFLPPAPSLPPRPASRPVSGYTGTAASGRRAGR